MNSLSASSSAFLQPTPAFRIRRDVLEQLDPLRKMAALSAIKRGHWILEEGQQAPVLRGDYGNKTAVHS